MARMFGSDPIDPFDDDQLSVSALREMASRACSGFTVGGNAMGVFGPAGSVIVPSEPEDEIFPVAVTGRDGGDYEFAEQANDPETGGLVGLAGGRGPGAVLREMNGGEFDDFPFFAQARFRGPGVVDDVIVPVFEFEREEAGGGGSVTVKALDGTPSYSSISTVTIDQANGLTISQSGAGIADVGVALATVSVPGTVSTTSQGFAGVKNFQDSVTVGAVLNVASFSFIASSSEVRSTVGNADWGASGEYQLGSAGGANAAVIEFIYDGTGGSSKRTALRHVIGVEASVAQLFSDTIRPTFDLSQWGYTPGGAPANFSYNIAFAVYREAYAGAGVFPKFVGTDVSTGSGAGTTRYFVGGILVQNNIPASMISGSVATTAAWADVTGVPANVTALAGLTDAANKVPLFTGSGMTTATVTTAAQSILDDSTLADIATTLGLGTGSTPQFTGIDVGNSDTTITRSSAGVLAVEGVTVPLNSTSSTHTAQQIELGHASDTTITRVSAGVIAVEGATVLTTSAIGSTVQAFDAQLTSIAGLSYSGNSLKVVRVDAGETAFELATITASVSDGDKGDVTVSSSGATWTIDAQAVTYAKIQDVAANSVPARASGSDGVLSAVALSASNLLGRGSTGNVAAITLGQGLQFTGTALLASSMSTSVAGINRLGTDSEILNENVGNVLIGSANARQMRGHAKGWIRYNSGTNAIADSYNVSSITDNGVGDHTINWNTDFVDSSSSAVVGFASNDSTDQRIVTGVGTAPLSTGTTRVQVATTNTGSAVDTSQVCVVAFGDQT